MKKLGILFNVALFILCFSGLAGANLIVNGSFEAADGSSLSGFRTLNNDTTSIPGWTVTGSIDWIGDYWQASDGNRSIDLAGSQMNGVLIGYSFSTEIGQSYLVEFDMAGNPDRSFDKALIGAEIIGNVAGGFFTFEQALGTRQNMGWTTKSFVFTADTNLSQLSFGNVGMNNTSWGAALDNVKVTAVPEPAAMFLFGAGLFGLAISWKKIMKN